MNTIYSMPITKAGDMARSRRWAGAHLSDAAKLPVSFVLDGQAVHGIAEAWQPRATWRRIDANITETVFEGTDPKTGLSVRVEVTEYRDYPVLEWVAWLANQGAEPTPILSDVLALDGAFRGASPVVYHCNGDYYNAEGYTPVETPVHAGEVLDFAPNGGRPSDGAFPYYRITFEEGGLALVVGWPGQWAIHFGGRADGVEVRAGQQKTNLRLLPGEKIRTPRMTALFWAGDSSRAANLWRRWYLAHVLPRPDGQPMRPLLACAGTDEGEEFTAATEENQTKYIDKFVDKGIRPDVWWIDAGWYPCYNDKGERRWPVTGTWKPDPERFPRGMKPVSDHAATQGAGLLVWFEPERVRPGTQIDVEHPEWLLRVEGNENALLNLGNPEARQWLTDHVCGLVRDNGIKIYRQDHNFAPLEYWRKNEPQDRQGMNENLHVQGYLRYWDELLLRNPGLWIDSCSSGGRRNDLETMRRSVPLHYTDYGYGDHPIKLAFHRTLFEWIPYFKECTLSWDIGGRERFDNRIDSYSFHCGLAAMLFPSLDIRRDDNDYALAAKMVDIWRRAAGPLLYGDYYPYTPFHREATKWVAWQFDCPETRCGFVQGIRLPEATDAAITIYLEAVYAGETYVFENVETGAIKEMPGHQLLEHGLTFALAPRSGAIWFYRRVVMGEGA